MHRMYYEASLHVLYDDRGVLFFFPIDQYLPTKLASFVLDMLYSSALMHGIQAGRRARANADLIASGFIMQDTTIVVSWPGGLPDTQYHPLPLIKQNGDNDSLEQLPETLYILYYN